MATNTRIDPLKAQRAAAWIAFQRTYRPSANDLKDYSSWLRWKEKFDPEIREQISDKLFDYRHDFEELGGYSDLPAQNEQNEHTNDHPTSGHGGGYHPVTPSNTGISQTPITPGDEKKAVSAVEELLKGHTAEKAQLPTREDYQKRNSQILLKALRKPPPIRTYTIPNTEMYSDDRFKSVYSQVVSDYVAGKLTLPTTENRNAALASTAETIFRKIHAKAAKEYDFKEKKRVYTDPLLDPVYAGHLRQKSTAEKSIIEQHNEQLLKRGGTALSPEEEKILVDEEHARQNLFFALSFPQKALAYAEKDEPLKESVTFLEAYVPSEEDEIHPSWEHVGEEVSDVGDQPSRQNIPLFQRRLVESQPDEESTEESDESPPQQSLPRLRQPMQQQPHPQPPHQISSPLRKKGAKKAEKMVGNAAKNAIKQGAKQVVQKGLAATSEFWGPGVAAAIGIILLLLLFVLLIAFIIFLLMGANQANQESDSSLPPVIVSKSVDKTEMKNPVELSGDEKNLTYTISTSYADSAEALQTTEVLPDGLSFVSATGAFTAYDAAGSVITNPTTDKQRVKKIVWSTNNTQNASSSATPQAAPSSTVTATTYTQPPFSLPAPSGNSDITFSNDVISKLNGLGSTIAQHQPYLRAKVKNPLAVDPFAAVIWAGAIEGTGGNPYSWNCLDRPGTINEGCAGGFTSGGWQVSYGNQVSQAASHIVADFIEIYSVDSPEKVHEVGQAVIDNSGDVKGGKIINPATFPTETVASLKTKATSGDVAAQQAIALLLMDPKIGAIAISQEVAGDIAGQGNWRATMEGWGPYYVSNMQKFSNRMSALAKSYTGSGESTNTQLFPPQTYTLTLAVADSVKDTYIINQATAVALGARTSATTTTTTTASGSASVPAGGNEAANDNTCNGKYTADIAKTPLKKNFGDPSCTLDEVQERDALYALLKQKDPANADKWFFTVIPCESVYNPNAWADPAVVGTPDPVGAWGLFQMGRGRAGELDHGDVAWQQQVINAVSYNNNLAASGKSFRYWACGEKFWQ